MPWDVCRSPLLCAVPVDGAEAAAEGGGDGGEVGEVGPGPADDAQVLGADRILSPLLGDHPVGRGLAGSQQPDVLAHAVDLTHRAQLWPSEVDRPEQAAVGV